MFSIKSNKSVILSLGRYAAPVAYPRGGFTAWMKDLFHHTRGIIR